VSAVGTPVAREQLVYDRQAAAVDIGPIRPIIERVVSRWRPLQIWLFGSRARGDAGPDSDWDLLVIVPDCPEPADFDDPMTVWRVKRQPGVPSDLVVYRESDFQADRTVPNTLAYATAFDGVLVYER
jgi:predicted nucleotidyltransferase